MAFELGLAIAFSRASRHEWFVFEARPHRLTKSLSDLNEQTATGPPESSYLTSTTDVSRAATAIRRKLHADTLFGARAFDELAVAGRISAQRRIPTLDRSR